jgi:hypothetical protein
MRDQPNSIKMYEHPISNVQQSQAVIGGHQITKSKTLSTRKQYRSVLKDSQEYDGGRARPAPESVWWAAVVPDVD